MGSGSTEVALVKYSTYRCDARGPAVWHVVQGAAAGSAFSSRRGTSSNTLENQGPQAAASRAAFGAVPYTATDAMAWPVQALQR